MTTEARPLSADDLVGILIHRANQMASHLAVHGPSTNWDAMIIHVTNMYQDVLRAKAETEASMPVAADAPNGAAAHAN